MLSDMSSLTSNQMMAAAGCAVALGLVYCFLGYRLFKFVLGATGFVLAGSVAAAGGALLTRGNLIAMGVAGAAGGVCGAFALFFLYRVGVFFMGLLGAAVLAHNVLGARPEDWVPSVMVGAAVFGGLAALAFERPIMTFATAALGAFAVVYGVVLTLANTETVTMPPDTLEHPAMRYGILAALVILTFIGTASQLAIHKPKK